MKRSEMRDWRPSWQKSQVATTCAMNPSAATHSPDGSAPTARQQMEKSFLLLFFKKEGLV
jgi:hypothetical protein